MHSYHEVIWASSKAWSEISIICFQPQPIKSSCDLSFSLCFMKTFFTVLAWYSHFHVNLVSVSVTCLLLPKVSVCTCMLWFIAGAITTSIQRFMCQQCNCTFTALDPEIIRQYPGILPSNMFMYSPLFNACCFSLQAFYCQCLDALPCIQTYNCKELGLYHFIIDPMLHKLQVSFKVSYKIML